MEFQTKLMKDQGGLLMDQGGLMKDRGGLLMYWGELMKDQEELLQVYLGQKTDFAEIPKRCKFLAYIHLWLVVWISIFEMP